MDDISTNKVDDILDNSESTEKTGINIILLFHKLNNMHILYCNFNSYLESHGNIFFH